VITSVKTMTVTKHERVSSVDVVIPNDSLGPHTSDNETREARRVPAC
jgi:hypothetical protein